MMNRLLGAGSMPPASLVVLKTLALKLNINFAALWNLARRIYKVTHMRNRWPQGGFCKWAMDWAMQQTAKV